MQLTPLLSLLLVHDFLLAKGGIALPASHGLRVSIEKHKSRLTAEFTRARIRRKCSTVQALTDRVEASVYANSQHPRWVRVNSLKSSLEEQLATTFDGYSQVDSVRKVLGGADKLVHIDEHIPNLIAVSPHFGFAKCAAYKSGAIILQDKASCFPAYLLDPKPEDGDVIDGCAAPGNKTTHLAAIVRSQQTKQQPQTTIHAFEKDARRAKTLEKMVKIAGSDGFTNVHQGQDFLKVDPSDQWFSNVSAILLDPSCSGSGIVGRDYMPGLHLPKSTVGGKAAQGKPSKKRKRPEAAEADDHKQSENIMVDDDGNTTVVASDKDLKARLEALSSFQLTLLLHAFTFPAAKRLTYSTCSIHGQENEQVVLKALQSDVAQQCGWRILPRQSQVTGMQAWPVRGRLDACNGDVEIADACIRAYKDDGRGVMGFFVAAFIRDEEKVGMVVPPRLKKTKRHVPRADKKKSPTPDDDDDRSDGGSESDWSGFED